MCPFNSSFLPAWVCSLLFLWVIFLLKQYSFDYSFLLKVRFLMRLKYNIKRQGYLQFFQGWVVMATGKKVQMSVFPAMFSGSEASWSDAWTTSAGSFWQEGTAALLQAPPDVWDHHPTSNGEPNQPAQQTYFSCLYPRSHTFGHSQKCITTLLLKAKGPTSVLCWQMLMWF